jgi:hypothetical protein
MPAKAPPEQLQYCLLSLVDLLLKLHADWIIFSYLVLYLSKRISRGEKLSELRIMQLLGVVFQSELEKFNWDTFYLFHYLGD